MTNTLESILELFNDLSDNNAKAAEDFKEWEPMANYYEGKRDAYQIAAERIEMAITLHEASTFKEGA
jgi:hypothetical protein